MERVVEKIGSWVLLAGAVIGAAWAGIAPVYQALVVLIVADIFAGVMRAVKDNVPLNSSVAFVGMLKKTGELMLVGVSAYLHTIVPEVGSIPLPQVIAGFYIYVEGLSLIDNLAAVGVPIPDVLRRIIEGFHQRKG